MARPSAEVIAMRPTIHIVRRVSVKALLRVLARYA
jgi:hypothetical protein